MVFSCWGDREEEHEGSGVEFIWRGSPGESRGRAENSWWSKENEKRQDISKTSEVFSFFLIKFRIDLTSSFLRLSTLFSNVQKIIDFHKKMFIVELRNSEAKPERVRFTVKN